jgi:hypothetical protein
VLLLHPGQFWEHIEFSGLSYPIAVQPLISSGKTVPSPMDAYNEGLEEKIGKSSWHFREDEI